VAIAGPRIEPRPRLDAPTDAAIWETAAAAPWGSDVERLCAALGPDHPLRAFPLVVVVDDPAFTAARLENFLWITFTRSNPAADVHGVDAFTHHKHWGCRGPLVIDARLKPHHAPPVEEDPAVTAAVDALCKRGGPLAGLID
jgi:4-hydroxy-3-polyprenylbenzoate decarboxylase